MLERTDDREVKIVEMTEWRNYGRRLVDSIRAYRRGYDMLMEQLHNTAFIFLIPFDKNREGDGLYLRKSMAIRDNRPCSVLEMLVAFSGRAYREYFAGYVDSEAEMFWLLLHNLDLDRYANVTYDDVEVAEILDCWLNRRFRADGYGSIFPLKRPAQDQRRIEIWAQMNNYIREM